VSDLKVGDVLTQTNWNYFCEVIYVNENTFPWRKGQDIVLQWLHNGSSFGAYSSDLELFRKLTEEEAIKVRLEL